MRFVFKMQGKSFSFLFLGNGGKQKIDERELSPGKWIQTRFFDLYTWVMWNSSTILYQKKNYKKFGWRVIPCIDNCYFRSEGNMYRLFLRQCSRSFSRSSNSFMRVVLSIPNWLVRPHSTKKNNKNCGFSVLRKCCTIGILRRLGGNLLIALN